jgi:hypothetical protein
VKAGGWKGVKVNVGLKVGEGVNVGISLEAGEGDIVTAAPEGVGEKDGIVVGVGISVAVGRNT